jgi:hypothetical protein
MPSFLDVGNAAVLEVAAVETLGTAAPLARLAELDVLPADPVDTPSFGRAADAGPRRWARLAGQAPSDTAFDRVAQQFGLALDAFEHLGPFDGRERSTAGFPQARNTIHATPAPWSSVLAGETNCLPHALVTSAHGVAVRIDRDSLGADATAARG